MLIFSPSKTHTHTGEHLGWSRRRGEGGRGERGEEKGRNEILQFSSLLALVNLNFFFYYYLLQ